MMLQWDERWIHPIYKRIIWISIFVLKMQWKTLTVQSSTALGLLRISRYCIGQRNPRLCSIVDLHILCNFPTIFSYLSVLSFF